MPDGVAEAPETSYVVDFLSSSEGIQLNKAFVKIKDAKLRRRIIDLVRTMARPHDAAARGDRRPYAIPRFGGCVRRRAATAVGAR